MLPIWLDWLQWCCWAFGRRFTTTPYIRRTVSRPCLPLAYDAMHVRSSSPAYATTITQAAAVLFASRINLKLLLFLDSFCTSDAPRSQTTRKRRWWPFSHNHHHHHHWCLGCKAFLPWSRWPREAVDQDDPERKLVLIVLLVWWQSWTSDSRRRTLWWWLYISKWYRRYMEIWNPWKE